MKKFICFGEVLWDVFPTGEKLGGAPFNVCQRLSSFGNKAIMVSAVGKDELGERILSYFKRKGLEEQFVQLSDKLPTGKVLVSLDDHGSPSYDIVKPVAWDEIGVFPELKTIVSESDAFIFGSLVARDTVSKNTLEELLDCSPFSIFDLNLRSPFYSMELISTVLKKVQLAKFNDEEVILVANHFSGKGHDVNSAIGWVMEYFKLDKVCITLGSKGAVYFENGKRYQHRGFQVQVADTVGAGDSFLAGLIHGLFSGKSPQEALAFACAVGALVAASEGANPDLDQGTILNMMAGES